MAPATRSSVRKAKKPTSKSTAREAASSSNEATQDDTLPNQTTETIPDVIQPTPSLTTVPVARPADDTPPLIPAAQEADNIPSISPAQEADQYSARPAIDHHGMLIRVAESGGESEDTDSGVAPTIQIQDSQQRTRVFWTSAQEEALLLALLDGKRNGKQTEGSFKEEIWNDGISRVNAIFPGNREKEKTKRQCTGKWQTYRSLWRLWASHVEKTSTRSGWGVCNGLPVAEPCVAEEYYRQFVDFKLFWHSRPMFHDILEELLTGRLATGKNVFEPGGEVVVDIDGTDTEEGQVEEAEEHTNVTTEISSRLKLPILTGYNLLTMVIIRCPSY
jgi:Myb/SANT-like DNA-binding domain